MAAPRVTLIKPERGVSNRATYSAQLAVEGHVIGFVQKVGPRGGYRAYAAGALIATGWTLRELRAEVARAAAAGEIEYVPMLECRECGLEVPVFHGWAFSAVKGKCSGPMHDWLRVYRRPANEGRTA